MIDLDTRTRAVCEKRARIRRTTMSAAVRCAIAVASEVTLAVYRWPEPELLHAEPLTFSPTRLLADRFALVHSPSTTFAFDFRR